MNTFVCGIPGSGKTFGTIPRLVRDAAKKALVVFDPQESISIELMKHIRGNFIYDRIRNIDRGLQFISLKKSNKDGLEGMKEDKEERMRFARILLGRRSLDPSTSPLIWEWLEWGLKLVQCGFPLSWLPYAYQPTRPEFKQMVRNADGEIKDKFTEMSRYSRTQLRNETSPALRICEPVTDPSFITRCGNVDLWDLLKQKKTIIFSGYGVNRETCRTILLAGITEVIQFSEKNNVPVHLVMDEVENFDLITPDVLIALNTLRKQNMDITIITQSLDIKGKEKVLQSCQRREWYQCGPAMAEEGARDIAIPQLNENKVWYTELKDRQRHTGYTEIDGKVVSEYGDYREEIIHYQSLGDQQKLMAKELMTLPVGCRLVNHYGQVFKEHVRLLEELPWGISAKKAQKRAETGAPKIDVDSIFSDHTQQRFDKCSEQDSSQATRLEVDGL